MKRNHKRERETTRLIALGMAGKLDPLTRAGLLEEDSEENLTTALLRTIRMGTTIASDAIRRNHQGLKRLDDIVHLVSITQQDPSLRFIAQETLVKCNTGLKDLVKLTSGNFIWIRTGSLQLHRTVMDLSNRAIQTPGDQALQQLCYLFSKQPVLAATINMEGEPSRIAWDTEALRQLVDPLSPLTGLSWLIHITSSNTILKRNELLSRICGYNPRLSGNDDSVPTFIDLQAWVRRCRIETNVGNSLMELRQIQRSNREDINYLRISMNASEMIREMQENSPLIKGLIPIIRAASGIRSWTPEGDLAIKEARAEIDRYQALLEGVKHPDPEQRRLARRLIRHAMSDSGFNYRLMLHANNVNYLELSPALQDRNPLHQPAIDSHEHVPHNSYLIHHPRELAGRWQRGAHLNERISEVVRRCRGGIATCSIEPTNPLHIRLQPRA